jgi:REP element-mobilizing transposase RayT
MAQSLTQVYLQIVFSTRDRAALLQDVDFRNRTHAYLAGICRNLDCPTIVVGGVADHVHLLCRMSKNLSIADFLRDVKRDSSKWIKGESPLLSDFHWQNGYGAFSISPSHVEAVKRYIANQEEHHKTETFQDEYRRLLRKYGIEFDERYVWD